MDYRYQQKVIFQSVDEAVALIKDGDTVALGGFWLVRNPLALVEALVKRGARDLTILAHGSGLALEPLIAAGLVKKVIFSFASLDIFGLPPFFRKAVEEGQIEWEEWTALRMMQALDAGRQNLPSLVMQPPWGSDFVEETDQFKLITCPFTGTRLGMMRNIQPDVALIHAQQADENGNILIQGGRGNDGLLIGAAKQTIVSVEEIVPVGGFSSDSRSLIIPHFLVSRICLAEGGAYPTSCMPYYITDYWQLSHALKDAKQSGTYGKLRQPEGQNVRERISGLKKFCQVDVIEVERKIKEQSRSPEMPEESYTADELMACAMAAELKDHMVCTVGSNTPLSMVAYLLAKKTHAPNLVLIPFCGLNDVPAFPVTLSLAEVFSYKLSTSHWGIEDLWQWLYEKRLVAVEFGSTAQIDLYGRINNSIIGSREKIKVRLPGQAGLADVMNMHHNAFYYITRHEKRRLVERVDFASGGKQFFSRDRFPETGQPDGSFKVITNMGIFKLDPETKMLQLTHLHPGVTLEELQEHTGFPVRTAGDVEITPAPTKDQLRLIRNEIDPMGFRRLEFASGDERLRLIRDILDKEQQLLFDRPLFRFS